MSRLTKIFSFTLPETEEQSEAVLERQALIVEGIEEVIQKGPQAVLLALNEYAEISNLGDFYGSKQYNTLLYTALLRAGYTAQKEQDIDLSGSSDPEVVQRFLIGRAMNDLIAGNAPSKRFISQSSLALNNVNPKDWASQISWEFAD